MLDHPFQLTLRGPSLSRPPRGAESVQYVTYAGLVETDPSGLAFYDRLAELTLRGAPGRLHDASSFAQLDALRELEIFDLGKLDSAHWPADWPQLEGARIHGLRRVDANASKASLATVPDVRVSGVRSDEWIEANLHNPFREWDADDQTFGRRACAARKKAKTRATKLGAQADRRTPGRP